MRKQITEFIINRTRKYAEPIRRRLSKHGLRAALIVAILIILGQAILLFLNQVRPDHTVVGLKFEGNSVQSMNIDELRGRVKTILDINESRPVLIRTGKYQAHITARQLGAVHDSSMIEQGLLSVGRQGGWWQRLVDQDSSLLGRRNLKIGFSKINKSLASAYLQKINAQAKISPVDASFAYKNQQLVIVPEVAGTEINIDAAIASLQSIDLSKSNTDLDLPVSHPVPSITKTELEPLVTQAQQIVSQPLTITGGDKQVKLDAAKLTELIKPQKQSDPTSPAKQVVSISFNDTKVNAILDQLAAQVAVPAQPKIVAGQKVLAPGSSGTHIDGTHAKIEVVAELVRREQAPAKPAPSQPSQTKPSTSLSKPAATAPATVPATPAKPAATPAPTPATPAKPAATPAPTPATPAKPATTPAPTQASKPAQPTTQPATVPATPAVGDSIIIPVEKIDPPVINQYASIDPLGRYPAALNGKKMIYLTFDDGPGSYTEQVLDILKRYNIHAIFYLIGKNASVYPQTVRRIQAEGHTIGNHSYTHSDLTKLSDSALNDELVKTQNILSDLTKTTPDLFRPPYGSLSSSVYNAVTKNKLSIMMWSIDPRDWSTPGTSVIVQRVLDGATPGGNVLLHVNHMQTADALPAIIESLQAKGYTLP